MRRYCMIFLSLLIPLHAVSQELYYLSPRDQLDRPYVALFEHFDLQYPSDEMKSLRSAIQEEREQELDTCRKDVKRSKTQLGSARKGLKALNAESPSDTRTMAVARQNLHSEISALERILRDKERECKHTIPATFEIKLAKVDLLKRWPQRREQTTRMMEGGRSRERKHGDVDDIGYRKLTEDQDKDIAVGEQAIRQMAGSGLLPPEVQNPSVRQYVQDLAAKIARNSDLRIPLHVAVLDSADINAIALPGGYLFVTSGLFLACETESELAGIVSQKIAHIAARHATRASKRSIITKMFVPAAQIATGLFTGGVSNAGAYYGMDYGFQGLGLLTDRTMAAFNGNAQKEADQLGIQYAWKAGFDPKGFISFLDSVAKNKDYSRSERFFLTKPALAERLLDAFTEVQYLLPAESYAVDSAEFRLAKESLKSN